MPPPRPHRSRPPKVIERLISHLQFYDLYYRNTAAAAVVEQENRGPRLLIALIFQILLLLRIMERTLLFCCCAAVSANGNIFRFSSIPPRNKGTGRGEIMTKGMQFIVTPLKRQ